MAQATVGTRSPGQVKATSNTPQGFTPSIAPLPVPSSCPHWGSPSAQGTRSTPGISVLEKLIKTCPVWLQLGITESRASLILQREPPGEGSSPIQNLLIKEEKSYWWTVRIMVRKLHRAPVMYLEGSFLVFDNIFKLIAFYCMSRFPHFVNVLSSGALGGGCRALLLERLGGFQLIPLITAFLPIRPDLRRRPCLAAVPCAQTRRPNGTLTDILPFALKLPRVIVQATKYDDMEIISSLGSGFWGSSLNRPLEAVEGGASSSHRSCEVELPVGSSSLWYVNPVLIEEFQDNLPATTSPPGPEQPKYKRPAPLPPRPHRPPPRSDALRVLREEGSCSQRRETTPGMELDAADAPGTCHPAASRRRLSEPQLEERAAQGGEGDRRNESRQSDPVAAQLRVDCAAAAKRPPTREVGVQQKTDMTDSVPGAAVVHDAGRKAAPVPPPRRKRFSHVGVQPQSSVSEGKPRGAQRSPAARRNHSYVPRSSRHSQASMCMVAPKGPDVSLYSPEGGAPSLNHESHSASSTEEEADGQSGANVALPFKRSPTLMLDRAKKRLSRVNLSYMFTGLMSHEHKLQNRIVQLARDKDSYFGNLVQDHRTFTLETMRKHGTSTKMLQEIRQMMTQLKCYLIQSTELQAQPESAMYPEEKLEAIVEAALVKSVLKPLREPIYTCLREIHTKDTSFARLRDNQQVVLNTTTTDLGVTTSVPEAAELEKIQLRLDLMHKEYSPEKKISTLLKTCKMIYDSMSVGCPGRTLGADDFLPVLMYVVAHCNIEALMLDVEYMMELMDPALQLGEGKAPRSYYLITTYGALEHIKNYDILPMTRQFSLEVQDSIHRWEKRRTLNKAQMSSSSVQDFINVSFLEVGANTKTLGVQASTTTEDLCGQCAEKFEIAESEAYRLYVVVEGVHRSLAPEELPLSVKSSLHHSEHRGQYHFVYRPAMHELETDPTPCLVSQSADAPVVPCASAE
ncbi:ras and Rab interactor 3-like [Scleropages formosus]|uniref:Ras and Rab interactor 3-like n=1 Tax=Scleropages formosus TaxID=113540 RepID=A0A0P7VH76_SCLFO|nr:ras and Rab interactor 3-like [Scleropages formosus]